MGRYGRLSEASGPGFSAAATNALCSWTRTLAPKLVKAFFLAVLAMGVTLTVVTVHNLHPILDPISPVRILDKLSLWIGVHEQSAVVVFDITLYSSSVFVYVFQRHVADGSFFIASESKFQLLSGLFNVESGNSTLEERVSELLATATGAVPQGCFSTDLVDRNPAVLARIAAEAIDSVPRSELDSVISSLTRALEISRLNFNSETSLGTLTLREQTAMQWFSINLLTHTLKDLVFSRTALILDVGEKDVEMTFAVLSSQKLPSNRVVHVEKLSAFNHLVKLVTMRYPLGLMEARFKILTANTTVDSSTQMLVRSKCINPVAKVSWFWKGASLQFAGMEKPEYETFKEKNGPFAGKKVKVPVASFDNCKSQAAKILPTMLRKEEMDFLRKLLRSRPIYMEGLLLQKCLERGLTLPYKGGNVRMKSFQDSLKHACKIPNADQPFGCVDLMYLTTLLEKLFSFKSGSLLRSSCSVGGMTGEWPLAAAFHVYENGL